MTRRSDKVLMSGLLHLPDYLDKCLDIIIIGINPGLKSAKVGHYYAGPGNHLWTCLYMSGLVKEKFSPYDDHKLLDYGIGFTDIVPRATRGDNELTREEIIAGADKLRDKLIEYKPKVAVFNGKGIL